MGVEKNVYWTEKAQHAVFDATRVHHLPALDIDNVLQEQHDAFSHADTRGLTTPPPASSVFAIPGGTVQARTSDAEGLVGLIVHVPRTFWRPQDVAHTARRSFACSVVAACTREFKHVDGTRAPTLLISHEDQYFPIKRADLISACLTNAQRNSLTL